MAGLIFLSGGGDAKDSVLLDKAFLASMKGKNLLYIPIALEKYAPYFENCLEWIKSALLPLDDSLQITMWTDLKRKTVNDLNTFDAIYVGGGNTFKLLNDFRENGIDKHIEEFIKNGGNYYGGSAGAVVVGKDINTAKFMDSNRIGLTNTAGLNLIEPYSIWPHYEEKHNRWIGELINNGIDNIIAIPEGSGIIFDNGNIKEIGEKGCHFFN